MAAADSLPRVLVTGGAGYIGSHACKALFEAGFLPVAYDNLSTGWRDAVQFGPLEEGDLTDRARLDAVFSQHAPVAVLHFAALCQVGEAETDPLPYWRVNLDGSLALTEVALAHGCRDLVFSSSCATYGDRNGARTLDEACPKSPLNAYGASKLAAEQMLMHATSAHGLRVAIFRYFNVAGADPDGQIGELHDPETHLVPQLIKAARGDIPALTLHGTDYDTPDGTCIRDYVHVSDLVEAHLLGLKWLRAGHESRAFNLGSGTGTSVRQMLEACSDVLDCPVPVIEGPARAGDCPRLVADATRARNELGWVPRRSDPETMIRDAWRWHQTAGYDQ